MKQLFSKFLLAFLLTSAVVLSWSEYFLILNLSRGSYGHSCQGTSLKQSKYIPPLALTLK